MREADDAMVVIEFWVVVNVISASVIIDERLDVKDADAMIVDDVSGTEVEPLLRISAVDDDVLATTARVVDENGVIVGNEETVDSTVEDNELFVRLKLSRLLQ